MPQEELALSTPAETLSAYAPLSMSLIALVLVGNAVLSGDTKQSDEGTLAHLWQILICGQIPVVLYFAVKWMRRSPKRTSRFLIMQAGGTLLLNFAAIFFLKLQ